MIFRSTINTTIGEEEDEYNKINAPETGNIEAYEEYMVNRGCQRMNANEDGEFIFVRNNERSKEMNVNGYDDSDEDNDETNNQVIVISDDEEDEEERSIYRRMMGALSERSTLDMENFSSIFTSNIISDTISVATMTTTTAATAAALASIYLFIFSL